MDGLCTRRVFKRRLIYQQLKSHVCREAVCFRLLGQISKRSSTRFDEKHWTVKSSWLIKLRMPECDWSRLVTLHTREHWESVNLHQSWLESFSETFRNILDAENSVDTAWSWNRAEIQALSCNLKKWNNITNPDPDRPKL